MSHDDSTRTCSRCRQTLSIDQFDFKNKATGQRNSVCRMCVRAYSAAHYQANRQQYIDRAKVNNLALRERKKEFIEELRSHPCTDCGRTFPTCCMDFDHRQGREIKGSDSPEAIANMKNDNAVTFAKLRDELNKCDLVCSNCHRIRTTERRLKDQENGQRENRTLAAGFSVPCSTD